MPGAPRPKHHPLAALFPMLAEDRRPSFRASLEQKQNHPIILHKGLILDGRNRERELTELNKPVSYVVFVGTERQALDLVIAENLERRDLTDKQRAMIAASIATLRLGDNQHTRAATPIGAPSLDLGQPSAPEAASSSVSLGEAAVLMNVPRRSVDRAAAIEAKGTEELKEAVKTGPVSLLAGAAIAQLPIEEQRAIVAAADPKVVKEVSKKNRTDKQKVSREKRLDKMRDPDATPLLSGGETVGLFYVDIPREFVAWSDDTGMEKSPENHYRTEGFDFLANMRERILARAKPNCVMVMWAWANSLQDQIDLMAEWGFASIRRRDEVGLLLRGPDGRILPPVGEGRYRSHQIWAKRSANGNLHQGTGFWFRDCHELLLVGCRGDVPAPLEGKQALSIIDAVKGSHSEKPNDIVREMLDRYFEGVPKLELFGRVDDQAAFKARWPLWQVWGNHGLQAAQTQEAAE